MKSCREFAMIRSMKTTFCQLTLPRAVCSSAMQAGDDVRFVKAQTQV
ncbi:MAG: hypothetical protein ACK6D5_16675 [Planctomyces sp.]